MRVTAKKLYILVGTDVGGFMFLANTIWDLHLRAESPPRTTSYAFDVIVNLLIWPSVAYFAGLVS